MVTQSQPIGPDDDGKAVLRRSRWAWYFLPATLIGFAVSFVEWFYNRNGVVFLAPAIIIGLGSAFAAFTPKTGYRGVRLKLRTSVH